MSRLEKELTEGGIRQMGSARLNKQRWGDRLHLGDPRDSEILLQGCSSQLIIYDCYGVPRAVVLPQTY